MATIYDIKRYLTALGEVLDTVEDRINMPDELSGVSLKELFNIELHSYFMYLAAADGKITSSERDFMNTLFSKNMSIQDYVKFVNDNNIYSTDFEDRLPITLRLVVAFDAKMQILSAITGKSIEPFCPKLMQFYLEAGKAFIACDGDVNPQEIEDLKTYVGKVADSLSNLLGSSSKSDDSENDEAVGFIGGKKGGASNRISELSQPTRRSMGKNIYGESIYKVGTDIPAGKYKLFVDMGRAYYAVCNDANCDDIVANDNFYGQAYIEIHNGQFLELKRCSAIPLDEAAMFDGTIYTSGEYIVGEEIPAGEYRLQADDGARGYYALETFASDGSRDIDTNNNFTNTAYIQARNGQILVLRRCTLRR